MEARSQLRHRPTPDNFLIFVESARFVKQVLLHGFGAAASTLVVPSSACATIITYNELELMINDLDRLANQTMKSSFPRCFQDFVSLTGVVQSSSPLASMVACALLLSGPALLAQQPPPPADIVRPSLNQISEASASLNISRWKAPSDVRLVAQRDVDSIQRDINTTLPPLLDRAAAAQSSVAASFAVYRNIDALYDVLLRVAETATLAGSSNEANVLEATLTSLETSRRTLGDSILQLAGNQEQDLVALRSAAAQAAAAASAVPPPAPVKTVVDDGPATTKAASPPKHRKKPVPAPPAGASPPSQ